MSRVAASVTAHAAEEALSRDLSRSVNRGRVQIHQSAVMPHKTLTAPHEAAPHAPAPSQITHNQNVRQTNRWDVAKVAVPSTVVIAGGIGGGIALHDRLKEDAHEVANALPDILNPVFSAPANIANGIKEELNHLKELTHLEASKVSSVLPSSTSVMTGGLVSVVILGIGVFVAYEMFRR